MPHLLRFAQTGINQQDTSQQSPLLLHSTSIQTIHIKDDNSSIYKHSEDNQEDLSVAYVDTQENPPDSTDPEYQTHYEPTLLSMGDVRSAIFSTYRGYCSELFVFGSCSKLQSGCKFDHSAATLELCIKSFTLLSKRDLLVIER